MNTSTLTSLFTHLRIPLSVLAMSLSSPMIWAQNPVTLQVQCPSQFSVDIYGTTCGTTVVLPQPMVQATCAGVPEIKTTTPWGTGNGPYTNVAAGIYTIGVQVLDQCGNTQACSYTVEVKDKRVPKPVLVQTLYSNLDAAGQVSILAAQLNQNSYDNCSSSNRLRYAFSNLVTDTLRTFTCAHLGVHPVTVFVFDEAGNIATAMAKIEILDAASVCTDFLNLSAKVINCKQEPVSGVVLVAEQNDLEVLSATTNQVGVISAQLLDNTRETVVTCAHHLDPLNGVNTLDLYHLNRYLLGLDTLSPWQLIAADANFDNKVTSSDFVAIKKVILGITDQFVGGRSWRFIPSKHQFLQPRNPFLPVLPEEIKYSIGSSGTQIAEWIGVKTGDLNMSSNPNLQSQSESRTAFSMQHPVQIKIQDAFLKSGQLTQVPVFVEPHIQLAGFQFSLQVAPQYLDVVELKSNDTQSPQQVFTHLLKEEGTINTSYIGDLQPAQRFNLFTVSVMPKNDGYVSDFISLQSNTMAPEAFNKSGTMYNIQLDYAHPFLVPVVESDSKPITMIGNSPNPFVEMSILHFSLAQDASTTLRVFDSEGTQVHTQRSFFTKGSQMYLLKKEDLGNPGVYHCRIETDLGCVTRKVILF
jgi:hypothetical protein